MVTKQELANDPDILALSMVDDTMLQLLSPLVRMAVKISRKLVAENPTNN
jgi:hypothetical protein